MWGLSVDARYQATPPRSERVGDAVDHGVEERAPLAGRVRRLGQRTVEQVGQRGQDDEQQPGPQGPGADGDRGADDRPGGRGRQVVGVRPVRRRPSPSGLTARSTGARNLPSNTWPGYPDYRPRARGGSPVPSPRNRRQRPGARPTHSDRWGSSTVKTYPTANIRNVALRRAQRERARRRWSRRCWPGRAPSRGPAGSTTARPSRTPNPRRSSARSPSRWPSPRSSGTASQDQPHRHARLRRLHGRGGGRAARRRPGRVRRQRGRGRRGADRGAVAPLRRARAAPHGLRQQGGQGAGRLPPRARPAPGHVRLRASPRWSSPSARRPRFHGVADVLSDQAFEYEPDGTHHTEPMPGRARRRGAPRRTTSSSRRSSPATTSSSSATSPARCRRSTELERTLAHEVLDGTEFPVLLGSAAHRRRRRPAGRLHLRDRPVAGRPARRRSTPATSRSSRSPPTRPGSRWPTCSRRSPIRSSASSRCSRCCRAPIKTDDHLVNAASGADERLHGLFHLRGKEQTPADVVPPATSPPSPSWPTPTPATRWRPKGSPVRVAGRHAAAGRARHRGRARGRRPTTTSWAARCSASRPRTRRSSSSATRRPARRSLRGVGETHVAVVAGAPGPQVRRERRHRGRPGAVPGDDRRAAPRPRARSRSRPAATASSPWPTCASSPSAAARASSSSTRSSAVPSPASTSPPSRRASRRRWRTGGVHGFPVVDVKVECYDGKYHNVDSSEMAFRTAASSGSRRRWPTPAWSCSSRSRCSIVRVPAGLPGRRDGRHQLPSGPGAGHERPTGGESGDHRPRADGRDPPLRDRPALDDGRPGQLHRHPRPLRRAARPPVDKAKATLAAAHS